MQHDPDSDLVLRIGRGDRAAAQLLMARHLPKMLGLARRMLAGRDPAEAEDAVQEAFLRIWQHAGRWQPGKAKFESWIYRVVLNQCYDRLRKKPLAGLDAASNVTDPAPAPDAGMLADEYDQACATAVNAALARLPERQRAAILLCHYKGMSNIKAAETLHISVEAMESLLSRGRRALRGWLADFKEE